MHYGMVIDLKRCIGCSACTIACKLENRTPENVYWTKVLKTETGKYPAARGIFVPRACNHCTDAPCVRACPTGASHNTDKGVVIIDKEKCMGCRYCVLACPYHARSFEKAPTTGMPGGDYKKNQGTVSKCTFCQDRVTEGKEPACVSTCPAEARVFGDLDDPNSQISRLLKLESPRARVLYPEAGTKPNLFYLD